METGLWLFAGQFDGVEAFLRTWRKRSQLVAAMRSRQASTLFYFAATSNHLGHQRRESPDARKSADGAKL